MSPSHCNGFITGPLLGGAGGLVIIVVFGWFAKRLQVVLGTNVHVA
jgi:hypothetical protein